MSKATQSKAFRKGPADAKFLAGGKQYNYIGWPRDADEGIDRVFWDLTFKEMKFIGDEEDKYGIIFTVVDTNTKLRTGDDITLVLDPNQKFAETYFWKELFQVYCALRGLDQDEGQMAKLLEIYTKIPARMMKASFAERCGGVTCTITRGFKNGKEKTYRSWTSNSTEGGDDDE